MTWASQLTVLVSEQENRIWLRSTGLGPALCVERKSHQQSLSVHLKNVRTQIISPQTPAKHPIWHPASPHYFIILFSFYRKNPTTIPIPVAWQSVSKHSSSGPPPPRRLTICFLHSNSCQLQGLKVFCLRFPYPDHPLHMTCVSVLSLPANLQPRDCGEWRILNFILLQGFLNSGGRKVPPLIQITVLHSLILSHWPQPGPRGLCG